MKNIVLMLMLFIFLGCTPKISDYFAQNKYVKDYNIHIINDSLQLYFKSPADLIYTTDRKELKKVIRQAQFKIRDNVLVHGKTDDPPYEYFVALSNDKSRKYPTNLVVFDTVVNRHVLRFIGNPLVESSRRILTIDLFNIFKSLEIGSNYRRQINTVFDIVNKYQKSNKFYAALHEIKMYPSYDQQEEWAKLQMELTFSSFLGKNEFYTSLLNKLESRFTSNDTISKIIMEKSVFDSDVIDTIVNEAKKHKIVMINENHYYFNQRVLVYDLLEKLKAIGYNYLALEALDNRQDSLLNLPNSFPTLSTGFYTSEQNYSNLIRKGIKLGFKFVAYENISGGHREEAQADNIYNKTFKTDPDCKVLVLAGIDHILEKPTSNGKEWMATIFKKKYDIDPLTISQTHLNAYRNKIKSNYGIINSAFFNHETLSAVDYLVMNNKSYHWAQNFTSQYPYKNTTQNTVQIALFYGNEIDHNYDYINKVPYFTTILKSGEKIDLPIDEKQDIYLYTFDKNGQRIDHQLIMTRDQ
ncbi:MAG: hypothetical protein J5I52_08905 [Saprospiraceae bacterium]|nr:hypothetical protein [Saprospiraceae bacterium]MCZ2338902.1 hypothetical protein [Chitinophagales bacterium]